MNRKPVDGPWGGGNHFLIGMVEECKKRGWQVTHTMERDVDIIYLHDPRPDELGVGINEAIQYKTYFPGCLIVHRVNECDARKATTGVDNLLKQTSMYTGMTIFVSEWMKQYHLKNGWHCDTNIVFYNGVKKDHFFEREKLSNGKINIVTHHWSSNYLKGFDVYNLLDEWVSSNQDYTFTYIGREQGTFKNTKVIPPLFGKALGEELGKYDVYVSASRFDPGPNHILESLACNIPTYSHVDGGGAVEFSGESHTYKDFDELKNILLSKNFSKNNLVPNDWKKIMSGLCDQLELKVGHEKSKNSLF